MVSTERVCRDRFNESRSIPFRSSQYPALPDRLLVENCAASYQKSSLRYVFPVLDSVLFRQTIRIAYGSADDSPDVVSAKTCVIAFLIFAHLLQLDGALSSLSQISEYFTAVQQLLPTIIEAMTVDTFQTCVTLVGQTPAPMEPCGRLVGS